MSLERLKTIFAKKEEEPFAGTHAIISRLYFALPNECKYSKATCASLETELPIDLSTLLAIQDSGVQRVHISALVNGEESWVFVGTRSSSVRFTFERSGDKVRKITFQRAINGTVEEEELLSQSQNPVCWNSFKQAIKIGMNIEDVLVDWACPAKENGLPGSVV